MKSSAQLARPSNLIPISSAPAPLQRGFVRALAAGFRSAVSTHARQIVFPLLLLSAGLAFVQPCTATPFGWEFTGSLHNARTSHTATLLLDGRVLVAGGVDATSYLASAEIYDPAIGAWTLTGSLNTARSGHRATRLADGRVLVIGGYNSTSGFLASAEIYDPATGTWTTNGNLSTGRSNGFTATLLHNGIVLVAGGGAAHLLGNAELYNPETGMSTIAGGFRRAAHTATLLTDGRVLLAGGKIPEIWLATARLYNPVTRIFDHTGDLNTERANHTATLLPDGRVLVAGGFHFPGFAIGRAELYDPATGTWADTRRLKVRRFDHTATLLADGTVLVAGGVNYDPISQTLASAEFYQPANEHWTPTGSLNNARYNHTATLLANGQVLVAGGASGSTVVYASAELYTPADLANNDRGN
jgi:hypothetical protein